MEKVVIFRDYQEQQAQDHNDLQGFARESLDHIVRDAVTSTRRFSGFTTSKTAQAEIQILAGRFYDVFGIIYNLGSTTVQSMLTYLPVTAQRVVSVSVYGIETETDTEERDYLVDVFTGRIEPRAQATVRSRAAVLVMNVGTESSDPQPPAIPSTHVEVARVLLDTTQVVSVTMMTDNMVVSTGDLDFRTDSLEEFEKRVGKRIDSLANDLADLASRLGKMLTRAAFVDVFMDLARVKATLKQPATAANYDTDYFLDYQDSNYLNTLNLGYDVMVEMGARFGIYSSNTAEIALFSPNDDNAKVANGVLLPAHTDVLKMTTGPYHSEVGIAQYEFQDVTMQQGYMSRSRLRFGGSYMHCSNSVSWDTGGGQPPGAQNLYDFAEVGFSAVAEITYYQDYPGHEWNRTDRWWYDTWKEPYMYAVTTEHDLNGALVAQTWTQSSDTWATKLGVYITSKAAAEDIHIAICDVIAGVPDPTRVIMKTTLASANIVLLWNRFSIPYTFLQKGKRYGLIIVSNANHKFGMAEGQGFLNGTFFYSTDGAYFQGDLTKDLMMEIWGAKFNAAQVSMTMNNLSNPGGFRNFDMLAEMYVPDSTQLLLEMKLFGTGIWLPMVADNSEILQGGTAPQSADLRFRFIGTVDMMPAVKLTGSRIRIWRPKQTFKHISNVITLGTASTEIHVIVILENFDETPHDLTCILRRGGPTYATVETADATSTTLVNLADKRYKREFTFTLTSLTAFVIEFNGTTNAEQNTFLIAERTYYSL